MVVRGAQCGVGAVGQRLPSGLAQLLRFGQRQASWASCWSTEVQIGKDHRQSFRLTRNGFSLRPNGRLFLAKVGEVVVRWSRELPSMPSSATIIREPDGHFYASFVVDVAATPLPAVQHEAGVDVGIARLATIATTDGQRVDIENPKHLGAKLRKLRRLEREKSRRQKDQQTGTRRGAKSLSRTMRWRARRDYHHKRALALVRENQVIHVEDLNIAGMVRNRRLAPAPSPMRGGGNSCGSSVRRPTVTGAPCTRCRDGWRRAKPARPAGTSWPNSHCRSGSGRARHARWSTTETTTPPKSFSLPGGQRD